MPRTYNRVPTDPITCVDCTHKPFESVSGLRSHRRSVHHDFSTGTTPATLLVSDPRPRVADPLDPLAELLAIDERRQAAIRGVRARIEALDKERAQLIAALERAGAYEKPAEPRTMSAS